MAIIGISGKAGSGKDTIGRIIQYLTCGAKKANIPYEEWDGDTVWNVGKHSWEIKKFATPIKKIVSTLTKCDLKDLENVEFKESKAIGEQTYRDLMRYVGFALTKDDPNIWLNYLLNDYKKIPENTLLHNTGYFTNEIRLTEPNWIITDVRFLNEIKAIENLGGLIVRVEGRGQKSNHYTENSVDYHTHPWDWSFINDTTIDELIVHVEQFLLKNNISMEVQTRKW